MIAPAQQLDGSEGDRQAALERMQGELAKLERELLEREYVRRADGFEHVRGAVRALGELGSQWDPRSRGPGARRGL